MRFAIVCALLAPAALLAIGTRAEPASEVEAADNDVTPVDADWGKHPSGLQVQIRPAVRVIHRSEARLPVVVWFRNPTDKPLALESVFPAYAPHGDLTMTGPDGKNVIVGECRKKHRLVEIAFAGRQLRGFQCDAFEQRCYRRAPGDLKPGKYTLRIAESNAATVEVVE